MHMASVLLYELCKAYVIGAQFTEPVEDIGLTGVKKGQVLGHLWAKRHGVMFVKKRCVPLMQKGYSDARANTLLSSYLTL